MLHAVNGISFLVGYLNAEFLLDGHHHLNGIQAVKAKVVRKVRCAGDLQESVSRWLPCLADNIPSIDP
jgi:hypothetical protein